jgi:hypothetical protein
MTLTSGNNGASRKDARVRIVDNFPGMTDGVYALSAGHGSGLLVPRGTGAEDIGTFFAGLGKLEDVQKPGEDLSGMAQYSAAGVAVARTPPVETPRVRDPLVLHEHFHEQISVFSQLLLKDSIVAGMAGYTWYSAKNFNKAHRWCLGLIAASKASMPIKFFVDAIVDLYHFDRALHASAHSRARHDPVRRTDIPQELPGRRGYTLRVKPFAWGPTVPDEAVDIVSDFLQETTPDKLWIAEYARDYTVTYDPIIYATFGPWELELVRWD